LIEATTLILQAVLAFFAVVAISSNLSTKSHSKKTIFLISNKYPFPSLNLWFKEGCPYPSMLPKGMRGLRAGWFSLFLLMWVSHTLLTRISSTARRSEAKAELYSTLFPI